jgi:sulfate permease, SulP family
MRPYLFDSISSYNKRKFQADLGAGMTVGLVALPLALAIGAASGAKPENGLITGVIGGLLVSIFGGSRVQIGGPAAAFIGVVYGIVTQFGFDGLMIALMLSGVIMFVLGLLKFGNLLKFIPDAVVVGFTNGIAVLIVVAQIKAFLGLNVEKLPGETIDQARMLWAALPSTNFSTFALGVAALMLLFSWPKSIQTKLKLPATVVVLLLGSLIAPLFSWCGGQSIATIGSAYGDFGGFGNSGGTNGLGNGSITLHWPTLGTTRILDLISPAVSLALLGAIESLLCAKIADDLFNKERNPQYPEVHDSNQELIGQGIANFFTPLFGGLATTGTMARTITNVKSGAQSPLAGIFHALTLLLILLVAAPLAKYIPMTILAAILFWVAWGMFDVVYHLQKSRINASTALITLTLTIFWGLAPSVIIGTASYWLIRRVTEH